MCVLGYLLFLICGLFAEESCGSGGFSSVIHEANLPIVVVSGFWRSGTSMLMGVLDRLQVGVHFSEETEFLNQQWGASWKNSLFYEDQSLVEHGVDETGIVKHSLQGKAVKIFSYGFKVQAPSIKSRMLVLACRRPLEDIIGSLEKAEWNPTSYDTDDLRAKGYDVDTFYPDATLQKVSEKARQTNLETDLEGALDVRDVQFKELLTDPETTIQGIVAFLRSHGFFADAGSSEMAGRIRSAVEFIR